MKDIIKRDIEVYKKYYKLGLVPPSNSLISSLELCNGVNINFDVDDELTLKEFKDIIEKLEKYVKNYKE